MKALIIDNRFVLGRSSRTENLYNYLRNRLEKVDVYCRNRKFPEHKNIHKISSLSLGIYMLNKLRLYNLANHLANSRIKLLDVNVKWALNAAVNGIRHLQNGDLVISSSPDECNHLAGLIIKSFRKDIFWISDWRDPWTDNEFKARYHPSNPIAHSNNKALERSVLKRSDTIWANTDFVRNLYISKYNINEAKIKTVRNGYKKMDLVDHCCMTDSKNSTLKKSVIKIFFFGILKSNEEYPWLTVFDFISRFNQNSRVRLELHYFANEDIFSRNEFNFIVRHPKKSYERGMETMANEADMCFILMPGDKEVYKGIIPQKLYDYLQLKLPIFFIGSPDSEVSELLKYTNSGFTLDINNLKIDDFQFNKTFSYENIDRFDFEQIFTNAFSKINNKLDIKI